MGRRLVERSRYQGKYPYMTRRLKFETYKHEEIDTVMQLIRDNLTPDLLTTKYKEENKSNPMYGHCYHSTQALFYLVDGEFEKMSAIDYRGDKHWWLQNGEIVYDVTAEQYWSVEQTPPYEKGKKSKWYGWKERPHARSMNLIVKCLGDKSFTDDIDIN